MSGAVASLSWGVVTTRTCTVDLKKQVGKSNSATCQPRLAYTWETSFVNFLHGIHPQLSVTCTCYAALTPMHFPPLRFNTSRFDRPAFHFGS